MSLRFRPPDASHGSMAWPTTNLQVRDDDRIKHLITSAMMPQLSPLGKRNRVSWIPAEYLCPITKDVMTDPVICADGFTYDRHSIEAHLKIKDVSPLTQNKLQSKVLIPNQAIRSLITKLGETERGNVRRRTWGRGNGCMSPSSPPREKRPSPEDLVMAHLTA